MNPTTPTGGLRETMARLREERKELTREVELAAQRRREAQEAALVELGTIGDLAAEAYEGGASVISLARAARVSRQTMYRMLHDRGVRPGE